MKVKFEMKKLEWAGQMFKVRAQMHPRSWVQTLRKAALVAYRKGNFKRAKAATILMQRLNREYNLGYPELN